MLTPSLMGYVALWILWGNTLLVALAAAKQALELRRRSTWLEATRPTNGAIGSFRGRVTSEGAIAELAIDQNGRHGAGAAPAIVWHDRAVKSASLGGSVDTEGAKLLIGPTSEGVEVWLSEEEVTRAARCEDASAFESAYAAARRVKGYARTVVARVDRGTSVWVAGRLSEVEGERETFALGANEGRIVVATIDPNAWAKRRAAIVLGVFIPGIFAGAAGCTALALTEPVFEGLASKAGGLLGLVFFLLVLPAGVVVRDFMREPHRRFLRGRWRRPADAGAATTSHVTS